MEDWLGQMSLPSPNKEVTSLHNPGYDIPDTSTEFIKDRIICLGGVLSQVPSA